MAKSKNFLWVPGEPPPLIEPHSVAKLNVLHGYLTRYVETLGSVVRMPVLKFDVVDGFAGGGLFTDPNGSLQLGSPLTFLDSIEFAKKSIGERRGRPLELDVRYYFVDKDKRALDYLEQALKERDYGQNIGENIFLIHDEYMNVNDKIVGEIKKRSKSPRAIFFLDQFGYTDVPFGAFSKIFSQLPRAEIILNFATDFLATYANDSAEFRKALSKAEISESILEDPAIAQKDKGWRFVLERELSQELRKNANAAYSTPFYVVSEESHNAYWLVHLCLHPKAHDEMLKTHWDVGNIFRHYGAAGADMHMWGYKASMDENLESILDFGFKDQDRQLCVDALSIELPRIIYESAEGMTYSDLMDRLKNNTVAWQDLIKSQLVHIQSENHDLEIITPNGNTRRSASGIGESDVIRRPLQRRFYFGKQS